MLSEKNQDIKKAYDLLQIISKDEKGRMLYEAREAELRDQLTRLKVAEDKGRAEGRAEGKIEGREEGWAEGKIEGREEGRAEGMNMGEIQKALRIAEKMLRRGDSVEDISELTELLPEKVAELKDKLFSQTP